MTTERSTYTYVDGAQETVTLRRSTITPRGHALLQISYSDGRRADCYVNTAWLRDRVNDLDPRPLTPDAITDEMVERARSEAGRWGHQVSDVGMSHILAAALTEPPTRPEWADGAEEIEAILREEWTFSEEDGGDDAFLNLAERLAERGVRVVGEERS